MKILCVGDSNTYGYDPRSYIGSRYPAEVRWTDRLGGHEVINAGINGMTVLRGRTMFSERIRRTDADLVIIMLGTNDILVDAGAYEVADRMDRFLASVTEFGKPILLISPPPLRYGEWVHGGMIEESEELGSLYRELAGRYGCFFADAGDWDIEMTFDGVHFSAEGHAAFAQKAMESIMAAAAR